MDMFGNVAEAEAEDWAYECKMTKVDKLINTHIVNFINYKGILIILIIKSPSHLKKLYFRAYEGFYF